MTQSQSIPTLRLDGAEPFRVKSLLNHVSGNMNNLCNHDYGSGQV